MLWSTPHQAPGPVLSTPHQAPGAAPSTQHQALSTKHFELEHPAEVVATIQARCAGCDWGVASRETAALDVRVDGRYSQHLLLVRGDEMAEYRIMLGTLERGTHHLRLTVDRKLTSSALDADTAQVDRVDVALVAPESSDYRALAYAPIVYARRDAMARFTDVPVFSWYETEAAARGMRYRYTVIFTNEDGGTPADRLMATWGRTTDIEYVYGVELDRSGTVLADEFQGPTHEIRPFTGRREGDHPLLWVVTDNNMVSDAGETTVRFAPAPAPFDLDDVSREVVMDTHPWTYRVMAQELQREGKIVADAPPGSGRVPDPRRFVYVEACGDVREANLAFAVSLNGSKEWLESDRGVAAYRIARSGCFRGAVPVPGGGDPSAFERLRFQAFTRPPAKDAAAQPVERANREATMATVNRIFTLDDEYKPRTLPFAWKGRIMLPIDGPPIEVPLVKGSPASRRAGHRSAPPAGRSSSP